MRTFIHALSILLLPAFGSAQGLIPVWGGPMGGSDTDRGTAIALDATGHLYVSGSFNGTMDVDPGPGVTNLTSAGGSDFYVAKFDTSGVLLWARVMGGTNGDGSLALAVDAQGNVYTTGGFCGTADFDPGPGTFTMTAATTGQTDIFISKLDSDGNFVWAKGIIGGTWWDHGHGIAIDPSGNVVVTGRFYYQGGPRDFDPGPDTFYLTAGHEDIFVLKLDADGNFVWAVDFGTAPDESRGYSIALDAAGNIFTTGYFRGVVDMDPGPGTFNLTSEGTWNIFYLKLDPSGSLVWAKSLPISTTTYHTDGAYGRKIAVSTDGDLLVTGRYDGTIDFDPDAGTTELTSTGGFDLYVAKYTGDGALIWARSMGGSGHDEGYGIIADPDGGARVVGIFEGTADFDPGSNTTELVSAGAADIFVVRLDGNGDLVYAGSMGGSGIDRGYALTSSGNGSIYCTGWFTGTADLDPGSSTFNVTSAGSDDAFLIKLIEHDGTGLDDAVAASAIGLTLYPNPASDRLNIICNAALMGRSVTIELVDVTGRRVMTEERSMLTTTTSMELPAGTRDGSYHLVLRTKDHAPVTARVIVQH